MADMSTHSEIDFNLFSTPKKISVADQLAESAAKIALNNFEWRYATLLIFNSLICGIEIFIQMYGKSVIINNEEYDRSSYEDTPQYIIFGTNVTDIVHTLQWLNGRRFDNTGKFIVVCQPEMNEECDEHIVIETLWIYKIFNVVFLKSEKERTSGYEYLYRHDCKGSRAVRLNNLDIRNEMSNKKKSEIFDEKFLNLHKCPIIVSTFIQPLYMKITDGIPKGVDGDLLLIIAEALNASLKMMTPVVGDGWGALIDGNWTGSLGDVYNDLANFSMTFPAITNKTFTYFEMSFDYNFLTLVWITHPRETAPASLKLLHPFQKSTLIAIAITFIFVVVSAVFIKSRTWIKFCRKLNMAQPRSSLVFYSWMIFMGMPNPKLPKKTALLYVILIWIWYSFLIRTLYQASLIHSLKTDEHYSNFETVLDLIKSKYPIGGDGSIKEYYADEPEIYDRWNNMNTSEIFSSIKAVSNGHKLGVAVNMDHAILFLRKHQGGLFILPQKIVVSPTAIFFKKFSPLAASVNLILRRLTEAGITMKIYKHYCPKLKIESHRKETRSPIKLEHYTGCYVLLLVGWVCSLLILALEICSGRNIIDIGL